MNVFFETLTAVSGAIVKYSYALVLIVISLVFFKRNLNIVATQKVIIGNANKGAIELTASQMVYGIFGGLLVSLILAALGITFSVDSYIELILLISLLLMLIKPRFICFSYSGAVLGIISLIAKVLGFDIFNLNIVSLVSLVAILHIVEGILITIDGSSGAIPVFTHKDNNIIGGFALKRYWAMPIALIFFQSNGAFVFTHKINAIPQWWSTVASEPISLLSLAVLGFSIFYGAIGYNAITFTKGKKAKAVSSGAYVIGYGTVMLILAQISKNNFFLQGALLIIMPVLHEGMLLYQSLKEINGKPKFVSNNEGIVVLDVAEGSPAKKMGIKSGDVILEINNRIIETEKDIFEAIAEVKENILIKVKGVEGILREATYRNYIDKKGVGVVIVPKSVGEENMMAFNKNTFKDTLDKMMKK